MGMNAGGAEDEREREREEKYCHIMIIVNRCGMRNPTQTARKQGAGGGSYAPLHFQKINE